MNTVRLLETLKRQTNTRFMCHTATETGQKEHTFHVPQSYGKRTKGTHIPCATQLWKLDKRNTHSMCHTATKAGQKEHTFHVPHSCGKRTKGTLDEECPDQPLRYAHSKTFEGLSSSTGTLLWCTMSWACRHGGIYNCCCV
jgi:hypothetical protein